jgi:tetratricopeptide (TPR) repeat protein
MKTYTLIITTVALVAAVCGRAETNVDVVEHAIERAYLRGNRVEVAAAVKSIDVALVASPADPALLYERAFAHYAASSALFKPEDKDELKSEFESAIGLLKRVHGQPWEAEAAALHSTILGRLIGIEGGMSGMTLGPKSSQLMARAAKESPRSPRVLLFRAISLINTPRSFGGDPAEGAKVIQQALDAFAAADPKEAGPHWGQADAWTWLGMAKRNSGDIAGARVAWEKALAIEPNYGWVKYALLPSLDKKSTK